MFTRRFKVDPVEARRLAAARILAYQKQREKPLRRQSMMRGLFAGAVLGAAGMFILDPRTGRRRRALVRDKVVSLRHNVDDLVNETIPRKADYLSGFARGISHRANEAIADQNGHDTTDQVITDRVLSTVFRDPEIPAGHVNVDTVDQVVYLRGHLDDQSLVKTVENRTRKVEGVRDVINLINRPDIDPSDVHPHLEDRPDIDPSRINPQQEDRPRS